MFISQLHIMLVVVFKNDLSYAMNLISARKDVANIDNAIVFNEDKVKADLSLSFRSSIIKVIKKNPVLLPVLALYRVICKLFSGMKYRARFLQRVAQHNRFVADECWRHLHRLAMNNKEVAIFGVCNIAKILLVLTKDVPIKISGIYDDVKREKFSGYEKCPVEALKGYPSSVIISSLFGVEERIETLKQLGIKEEKIIRLV